MHFVDVSAHRSRQTVLLVDDEAGVRKLVRALLERHGYAVLEAANAAEATVVFNEARQIHILITDVRMPGQSGPALAEQLLASDSSLRILYMTGFPDEALAASGATSRNVLAKPFTPTTLLSKVRSVLDHSVRGAAQTAQQIGYPI